MPEPLEYWPEIVDDEDELLEPGEKREGQDQRKFSFGYPGPDRRSGKDRRSGGEEILD
ncbi:MAG: hypothetical protein JW806_01905 [Sedimentisphaerales bacterium]|nr:hypothetical protein [Sedimentisphaerales bacterium]